PVAVAREGLSSNDFPIAMRGAARAMTGTRPDSRTVDAQWEGTDAHPLVPAPAPLDRLLDEIDIVVEPVSEFVTVAPAIGIAGSGIIGRPHDATCSGSGPGPEPFRTGIAQAGPVAIAGVVVNGVGALVVVVVAHLVSPRSYGAIAQLLGLFFILSMPGSAVLVGVVRRVTGLREIGEVRRVHQWVGKVHRVVLAALGLEIIVVWMLQGWIARQLSLPNDQGVVPILVAAGIWILLSVDRGLLQAHRRYRVLAVNLLIEGLVKAACVVVLVEAGMGVAGYGLGILVSEVAATAHARWSASRASPAATQAGAAVRTRGSWGMDAAGGSARVARRVLLADVAAAFVGLALLGLLQNVDVILLGRLNGRDAGSYAAISVASKALVFGALAMGAYLLPEATIRWNEGGHAVRQLVVTLAFIAVPAVVLLGIALFVPTRFLSLIFTPKLSSAAPAFIYLVVAMIFLCISVLLTNYLFGVGRRWIVLVLLAGSIIGTAAVAGAHGQPVATARADLFVQAGLAAAMAAAFIGIHHRERGMTWQRRPTPDPRRSGPDHRGSGDVGWGRRRARRTIRETGQHGMCSR
ncbi:MAG: MATE family efflux transporter, partial [Acidimicrobiales bacterium]